MNEKQIDKFLRRKFSTVGWVLVFYNLMLYAMVLCTDSLGTLMQQLRALTDAGYTPDPDAIYNNGWGYIAAILVGLVILHSWKGPEYWRREILIKEKPMGVGSLCAILVLATGGQLASGIWINLVEVVMNFFGRSILPQLEAVSGASVTFSSFLYSALFAPVAEELLFRGYVLRSLRPYGKRFSILLSALLFAVFHGNILQLPYAFFMGLILGYVAAEYSIGWAVAVHAFNNVLLAELFSWLSLLVPEWLYYLLDSALFGGCALAAVVLLIAQRQKIKSYRCAEWMDRRCIRCFFTSSGIVVLLVMMALEIFGNL